jgi:imidazolonepropionase-like amidohydrolase
MRLSTMDAVGVGLVGLTCLVLIARGMSLAHRGPESVADAGTSPRGSVNAGATAFVDFNLLPANRDVVLPHQVVLVRGSVIERVGEVGTFSLPRGARRIDGGGSQYLLPGPQATARGVEPGASADLVLLDEDPRGSIEARRHTVGVMVRGRWYGREDLDRALAELPRAP